MKRSSVNEKQGKETCRIVNVAEKDYADGYLKGGFLVVDKGGFPHLN